MENQIDIVLKAIDEASSTIKQIQASLEILTVKAGENSKKIQTGNETAANSFMGLGKAILFSSTAYAAFNTAKGVLQLTSQVEQAHISFVTLLWSESAALAMMKDIDEFAAKTPFEKVNLTPLVQQLLGMGFQAKMTLPIMQVLGDSVAALWRGQEDLEGVTLALGKVQTMGRLTEREINEMAVHGLPVFQILKEKLGLTQEQLGNLGNQGISAATGISAILTGLNERFNGAMQRQNKTLAGQWSNTMDNLKAMVGNAGQDLNTQVAGWIQHFNDFFDANRPVIAKAMKDIMGYVAVVTTSIGELFGTLGSTVSDVVAAISGDTEKSTASQAKSWSYLLLIIANGIVILTGAISGVVKFVSGLVSVVAAVVKGIWNVAAANIADMFLSVMATVEELVNYGIKAYNLFASIAGKTLVDPLTKFEDASIRAGKVASASLSNAGKDIASAWNNMDKSVTDSGMQMINNLMANVDQYNTKVGAASAPSDLNQRITDQLKQLAEDLKNNTRLHGNAAGAAKEHAAELKKLKTTAEEALKPILEDIKKEGTEVTDTKKKITELGAQWTKYKEEALKAIVDVNVQLSKLRQEAQDITTKSDSDRDVKLGERLVQVYQEIADKKKAIADAQSGDSGTSSDDMLKMQNEMVALEQERDYITSNVTAQVIQQTASYAAMSDAQKITADAEAQKAKDLADNTAKQTALTEKRMILEEQANQKNITDMGILIDTKDWMMTASLLNEKGQRVEIHDAENIALANEIATKQAQYKADADELTKTLADKLSAQQAHILAVSNLYGTFNKYLKKDTSDTAQKMIADLGGVTAMLEKVISLRNKAGFASVEAIVPVAGARASGGPVDAWSAYVVGEQWSELFIPNTDGTIVPHGQSAGGTVQININMGQVSVRSDADIQLLTKQVGAELARTIQNYKLGIS